MGRMEWEGRSTVWKEEVGGEECSAEGGSGRGREECCGEGVGGEGRSGKREEISLQVLRGGGRARDEYKRRVQKPL